jgi:hypothetical protein
MTIFPEKIPVTHRSFVFDGGVDAHGNPTGALGPPVRRYAINVYQVDWQHPHPDPISIDYLSRTISEIILMCADPYNYKKLDRVTIFNGEEDLAYEVFNLSISWGPGYFFPRYSALFGGEVHGRRVS